jgi:F-type H+-transporting ATPase subunit delta
VSSSFSGQAQIAKRYAESLFASASSNKESEEIIANMRSFAELLAGSEDLQHVVKSPVFSEKQKSSAMAAIAKKAKYGKVFTNFLLVLAENGRLNMVVSILKAAERHLGAMSGLVDAEMTTAYELTDKELEAVQKKLAKQLGRDVSIRGKVDEEILGGMTLRVGSTLIDDSVRTKLERLERNLANPQTNSTLTHNLKEVG